MQPGLRTSLTFDAAYFLTVLRKKPFGRNSHFLPPFLSFPLPPFSSPYPEDEDRQRFILNLSVCGKLCERCE